MSCAIGCLSQSGRHRGERYAPGVEAPLCAEQGIISTDEGEREVPLEKEAIISELKRGGELLMIHSRSRV